MEERTLGVRGLWKEIIIILILVIASYYILRGLPVGRVGLFLFSLPAATGGYLIAKKGAGYSHALLIPAAVLVLSVMILSMPVLIDWITAGDEEYLKVFSNDPKWANYPVSVLKLMSVSGALFSSVIILGPMGLAGAWIGRKIGLRFPTGGPEQTEQV